MGLRDYVHWHDAYDNPTSSLSRRLAVVRAELVRAADGLPPGPIRLVSLCAGQADDVVVLGGHPRAGDVEGGLVELDPTNAALARSNLAAAGLGRVEVREADAGWSAAVDGLGPAQLLLVCGIFGNISDEDIDTTLRFLPELCAPGAVVLWTRNPSLPGGLTVVQQPLAEAGFTLDEPTVAADGTFAVGAATWPGPTAPSRGARRLFTFTR